jgi:hypothetical protein
VRCAGRDFGRQKCTGLRSLACGAPVFTAGPRCRCGPGRKGSPSRSLRQPGCAKLVFRTYAATQVNRSAQQARYSTFPLRRKRHTLLTRCFSLAPPGNVSARALTPSIPPTLSETTRPANAFTYHLPRFGSTVASPISSRATRCLSRLVFELPNSNAPEPSFSLENTTTCVISRTYGDGLCRWPGERERKPGDRSAHEWIDPAGWRGVLSKSDQRGTQ